MFLLVMASCKKDTSPGDRDFFIGKYNGHITYVNSDSEEGESIDKQNGSVEVVKVGSSYNFIFSDGIPNITGVKFENKGKDYVISIGSDESHYIKINADKLNILYGEDGKVWTANCTRN